MNTPPELDPETLQEVLRRGWGFAARSLEYAPLGFGSHHWIAAGPGGERRFVTVDDLSMKRGPQDRDAAFAALDRAFRSALVLAEGGLDFVVAPVPDEKGAVLQRLDERFSVAVFPFLEGRVGLDGEFASDAERRLVTDRVRELHRATGVVQGVAGCEDFALPWRSSLEESLRRIGEPWTGGPYGEPARRLLQDRAGDVREGLAAYDHLVREVRSDGSPFVITHGEPHGSNVMWIDGRPHLIDWDSALLGPPARDLWMLTPYRPGEDGGLTLYRLWWELAEIGGYLGIFRGSHAANEDTAEAWQNLQEFAGLQTLQAIRARRPNGG
ncbi:MAG: aminoglycoside phosphotransferase family protein [Candidatus Dormibacteraeota bacterium]|nr:aminoglycoside phosphotransferase family protein [Candidatus Dormibacteraeota bacterium]